jgi:uncharacterized protein
MPDAGSGCPVPDANHPLPDERHAEPAGAEERKHMEEAAWFSRIRETARARSDESAGPAHDFSHVLRVEENSRRISLTERAEAAILIPAAILHELKSYPKNHPDSPRSGEICAREAVALLAELGYPEQWIEPIALCIREHPFSLGRDPETIEGRILQDADRLDAIGAVGIARCFAVCGELRRPLYDPADPFCETHPPDDKSFGLDHFYTKLLKIPERLHTEAARSLALERTAFLRAFLIQMRSEVG